MKKDEICNNCSSWFSNHKGPEGSCRLHYDKRLFSDTCEHFTLKPEKYKEPRILCQECDGVRTVTDPGVIAPLLAVDHCRVCDGEGSLPMATEHVPVEIQQQILFHGFNWLKKKAQGLVRANIAVLQQHITDWKGVGK